MKHLHTILYIAVLATLLAACSATHENATRVERLPQLYPDYADVTIPVNIAPLNFLVRDKGVSDIEVIASCGDATLHTTSADNTATFGLKEWKEFLSQCAGKDAEVQVYTRNEEGKWTEYQSFQWHVVADSIDPYLTYRLIEPDYEVWNNLQIKERCIENFDEKTLADYNLQENRCMNCHAFGNQDPALSMMYVRGQGGGAILNRDGRLRKLDLKADSLVSSSVYYGFSPSGRYVAFSTNIIIPAFHADAKKRLEVYDTKSDVYVADLDNNLVISSPLTTDSTWLETFPTFSPDGKYVYYCTANTDGLHHRTLDSLQYALVRIPFDSQKGVFGNKVDTLFNERSVCHPRLSPDGKYLLFTVADYGTFPIWHPEADLWMLNLETGQTDSLAIVNSNKSDTYHSWSHNSRWFAFASKRDDGLYGKPYFCYIDKVGKAHKPFVLPQASPLFYDNCLKSFNIPELSRGETPYSALDIERAMKMEAEKFKQLKP